MGTRLPQLIAMVHWGTDPRQRVLVKACLDSEGKYAAGATTVLDQDGGAKSLLAQLRGEGQEEAILVGFDFPIGLLWAYAQKAESRSPSELFSQMSPEELEQLCSPDGDPDEICIEIHQATSPLFRTLGANQVGKGAISGWRAMILPVLGCRDIDLKLWPFDGHLENLLARGRVVVAETYPGEVYRWFDLQIGSGGRSKRNPAHRKECSGPLLKAADRLQVDLSKELSDQIERGFGEETSGEAPFEAFVGLLGMIAVVRDERTAGERQADRIVQVEGGILGQALRSLADDKGFREAADYLHKKNRGW